MSKTINGLFLKQVVRFEAMIHKFYLMIKLLKSVHLQINPKWKPHLMIESSYPALIIHAIYRLLTLMDGYTMHSDIQRPFSYCLILS